MILERLPEVQKLPDPEKRQLAEELWQAAEEGDAIEVDPAIIALLDKRLAEYAASPSAVSAWKEVEARVFQRHDT